MKSAKGIATKAQRIGEILDRLFPDPAIPLDHLDPFTFLVAVMLSAQTTDKKVNEVTPALFERARRPPRWPRWTSPRSSSSSARSASRRPRRRT
jgi:endonuclease III